MRETVEVTEGPGVGGEYDSGGGDGDTERVGAGGRPAERQKDEVLLLTIGVVCAELPGAMDVEDAPGMLDAREAAKGVLSTDLSFAARAAFFNRSLSLSFARRWSFFRRRSSSECSTTLYGPTPLRRLVSTSRGGRGSKSPARTLVAVRRRLIGGQWLDGRRVAVDIVRGDGKRGKKRVDVGRSC